MNMMTIDQACDMVREKYAEAKDLAFVNNPIAYALYQTWKEYESEMRPKLRGKGAEDGT